jgi:hypothetical protein
MLDRFLRRPAKEQLVQLRGERRLLEPTDVAELLRGWLVHAHKSRDRHDSAARVFEKNGTRFGMGAVIVSGLGTSAVVASLGQDAIGGSPNPLVTAIGAVIAAAGGIAAALQAFLDYPGRASRHHVAAAKYKSIIRELEQILTGTLPKPEDAHVKLVEDLRLRLDGLEESSPVIAHNEWSSVEDQYRMIHLVHRAVDLSPGRTVPDDATEVLPKPATSS